MTNAESVSQLPLNHLYARSESTGDNIPAKLFGNLIPKAARQTRLGHSEFL